MSEKRKLTIKIFDREYSLLVDNEDIAKELASYVTTMMEEIKVDMPDQPTQTVAIIASLNIAYDLFIERNNYKEFLIQASDKVKRIKLIIDPKESKVPS